jgi:hypothetical protein
MSKPFPSKDVRVTHQNFDQQPMIYGSITEGKVNPDLAEERSLRDFD